MALRLVSRTGIGVSGIFGDFEKWLGKENREGSLYSSLGVARIACTDQPPTFPLPLPSGHRIATPSDENFGGVGVYRRLVLKPPSPVDSGPGLVG